MVAQLPKDLASKVPNIRSTGKVSHLSSLWESSFWGFESITVVSRIFKCRDFKVGSDFLRGKIAL